MADTRCLAPGLYEVTEGEGARLEVYVPDLLAYWGFSDTRENRAVCAQELARIILRAGDRKKDVESTD